MSSEVKKNKRKIVRLSASSQHLILLLRFTPFQSLRNCGRENPEMFRFLMEVPPEKVYGDGVYSSRMGGGGNNNIIKMTRKEKDLYRFELV